MKPVAPLSLLLLVAILMFGTAPARAACDATKVSPACGITPSALFDSQGRLWVVFVDGAHVWLARSDDAGASYGAAVRVNAAPETIYADGENRPVLGLGHNGVIFVAWTRQNSATYSGDIRFARSVDGGRHFSAVTTINDDGLLTSHRFVALAVSPSGTLYLAWLDKRDQVAAQAAGATYAGAALYYTVSTDDGSTFARNRKVADHSCECCRLSLAPAGAEDMQVLWRHVFDEGRVRDHAIATLAPETASAPARATDDQWLIDGCPHHGPALAAGADGYHMSWFTNGAAQQGVIYGKYDGTTGVTSQVHTLDPRPSGGHPAVLVNAATVAVVWKSFDGTRMNLKLAQSPDGGLSWPAPRTLASTAGASDHPLALQSGAQQFIAWHTAAEGFRLLPLSATIKETQP